jgi:hypothetical protein
VDMWRGDTAGFHRNHSCVEAAIIVRALPPLRDNGLSLFGNGVGSPLYLAGSYNSHRQESRAPFGRPLWPWRSTPRPRGVVNQAGSAGSEAHCSMPLAKRSTVASSPIDYACVRIRHGTSCSSVGSRLLFAAHLSGRRGAGQPRWEIPSLWHQNDTRCRPRTTFAPMSPRVAWGCRGQLVVVEIRQFERRALRMQNSLPSGSASTTHDCSP